MVLFEKPRRVFFASSIMENIFVLSSSRFTPKSICFIAFVSEFSFSCVLKFIANSLQYFPK